jgi:putative heme iron utilization protein
MPGRADPLQPVDARARALASRLLRMADTGSLATLAEEDDYPFASLVTTATDYDGSPVLLLSALSAHTRALRRDPRCSLLVGQPGRGDPLAHPRLTVVADGVRIDREHRDHRRLCSRFLARHPAAGHYVDFADFDFYRLEIRWGRLTAGFANAFALQARDVVAAPIDDAPAFAEVTAPLIDGLNSARLEDVRLIARELCAQIEGPWRLVGIDPYGLDLKSDDASARCDFDDPPVGAARIAQRIEWLVVQARERGD